MCVYEIRFATGVERDLRRLKAYDRGRILDAIEKQLPYQATIRVDTGSCWSTSSRRGPRFFRSRSWESEPIGCSTTSPLPRKASSTSAIRLKRAGKRTEDILWRRWPCANLQKRVKACVSDAQRDRVIVTRHGKPAAVLVGVQGEDWDAVVVQTDPKFWRLIRARRRQPTLSLGQLKRRVGIKR
jgi:prevent-host-death family protein